MATSYFIGLMSGTSLDGVDAALVAFSGPRIRVIDSHTQPFPDALVCELSRLCQAEQLRPEEIAAAESRLDREYAQAVKELTRHHGLKPGDIQAIGSHGQTIRHLPAQGFSWQLGCPSRLAALTGIPVVAGFRQMDLALGGQGAPLAPFFHAAFFSDPGCHRVVINLGGIANISDLPPQGRPLRGWDTGPANCLMDAWYRQQHLKADDSAWDENGQWARSGQLDEDLLDALLSDPYFSRQAPKSTGPEHFNLAWLNRYLSRLDRQLPAEDVQRTLAELTIRTVAQAVKETSAEEYFITGGGRANTFLMEGFAQALAPLHERTAEIAGIPADQVESAGFAWLARERMNGSPLDLPEITGAERKATLGGIWLPA
ncbi:anhydro-N-acetylmuramic acid kinase [Natronospira proteinivora]|uniref:Anhydro-N-acetylmuramic acid kinase n=1 Tax=Natronospira proteinivora TaxID=1807133 RepID=A0ABT1GAY1_9GAMM|nr:anhydro-N-acetylmuramic acid kinase [Natronospira proteinivora]MCP1728486.1 anhydro-N-acetylmuramic acid kinase [Natronospira proteinivora]